MAPLLTPPLSLLRHYRRGAGLVDLGFWQKIAESPHVLGIQPVSRRFFWFKPIQSWSATYVIEKDQFQALLLITSAADLEPTKHVL